MTTFCRFRCPASSRVSAVYTALFSIACLSVVYLPQWFVQVGLTTAQVGLILAIAAVVKVPLTLLAGTAADLLAHRKRVLVGVCLLLLLTIPGLYFARSWLWLCVTWALLGGLISTCVPLTDSIAVTAVQRESANYGRMRMWGSFSFLVTSLVAGWLLRDAADHAFVLLLAAIAVVLCCFVLGLPDYVVKKKLSAGLTLWSVIRLRGFVVFLLAAATLMASHAALYSLSTVYWSAAGITLPVIGMLWAIGVIAEIGFFFISGTLLKKWSPWQLLCIAGVTGIVRWIITALVTDVQILVFIQMLHAITFTFTQLAVVTYIGREVPPELTSSAQALYDSCALGVIFAIALYASGRLSQIDLSWSFLAMAVLSAIGTCIAVVRVIQSSR